MSRHHSSPTLFGLVCAGGGAHGAYQVGVLKYIHEFFCDGDQSPFKIFAGTSCGGLNTSFCAAHSHDAHAGRLFLEELWRGFHVPSYHGNVIKSTLFKIFRELRRPKRRITPWSFLDPGPIEEVVRKGFKRENLLKAFEKGSTLGIAISATELLSGRACWFQEGMNAVEWNLFHSVSMIDQIRGEHLVASSSIPFFLPPVKLGERFYVDGSISVRRPFSSAISMGANKILSIATDKPHPAGLPTYRPNFLPRFSNSVGLLLNLLCHDHAPDEAAQIDVLNRFHETYVEQGMPKASGVSPLALFHKEEIPAHYHPTEIFLIFPSRRIRMTDIYEVPEPGAARGKSRTHFLFHESFIRELIDLGYEDARNKHGELKDFFTTPVRVGQTH